MTRPIFAYTKMVYATKAIINARKTKDRARYVTVIKDRTYKAKFAECKQRQRTLTEGIFNPRSMKYQIFKMLKTSLFL